MSYLKRIVPLFAIALFLPFLLQAQIPDPVTFSVKKAPKKVQTGDPFDVTIHADIKGDWHLYSVHLDPDAGPFPTKITAPGKALEIDGKIKESKPTKAFDPNFKAKVGYHNKKATFTIPLELTAAPSSKLKVDIMYQVCNDHVCLPPKTKAIVLPTKVQGSEVAVNTTNNETAGTGEAGITSENNQGSDTPAVNNSDNNSGQQEAEANVAPSKSSMGSNGIFSFIWIAILAGFAALVTPCVFPMIPLTVSYFSKQEDSGRGIWKALGFGLAIIVVFTVLGAVLAIVLGASGALQFAANPWVNLFIALVLIAFGLSLLGAFELRLPYQFTNYLNRKGNEGSGLTGIFFMALTISAVSFSCTAPFVGAVLATTIQGEWFYPIIGMIGFSAAFASPFVIFAMFPQWMESLPKSGSWMNIVKVLLGFIELAAAVKYLSNADLVWGTFLISRTLGIAIWISIFLLAAFYLLGVYNLEHEKKDKTIGVSRLMMSVPFLLFCFYLIPGLLGSSLGIWDAWLPPQDMGNSSAVVATTTSNKNKIEKSQPVWSSNYQQAVETASKNGNAVFIDFTGYTCTNCRAMETNVFPLPGVQERFGKMTLVRLYTDGKNGKKLRQLQYKLTGNIALPTYAIVNPKTQKAVATEMGYTEKGDFLNFLNQGLQKYDKQDS